MRCSLDPTRRALFRLCRAGSHPTRRLRAESARGLMSEQIPQRLRVEDSTTLRFPHHVKFRHDETRGRWVVLAPERLLLPDETAIEIMKLIDGERSVAAII